MKKGLLGIVLSLVLSLPALAAVNLNSATQAELEAVKGVGPSKAKAIIAYREKNGSFKSVDELAQVKGFGLISVNKLKDQFTVSDKPGK